jgi:hypothetical protein
MSDEEVRNTSFKQKSLVCLNLTKNKILSFTQEKVLYLQREWKALVIKKRRSREKEQERDSKEGVGG